MTDVRANREPLVAPGAIDHHAADMTATFSADVTLAAAQQRLAEADQWLPIDGDPQATLGALVEQNSTGPLRLGYGAWRDLLLGAQLRNGRDELVTAGGRTVKNVAGYDLTKFMVGQRGIFAKLVTLTTRTYKRPAAAAVASFAPDLKLVAAAIPGALRPQWMLLTREQLLFGYLSDAVTIDHYVNQLPQLSPIQIARHTLEEDIAQRQSLWRAQGECTLRAAVPPARVSDFLNEAKLTSWIADPAFGIILAACTRQETAALRQLVGRYHGTIAFTAAGVLDYDPPSEGQRALLLRLKTAFDPDNKLAPLPWK